MLTSPTWERIEVPYEGTTLPEYFYKVDNSGKRHPTVIFQGGFDSSAEELLYFGAAAAIRRGHHCLTRDGPGMAMPIREQNLHSRYDWKAVVTPTVDYALSRPDVNGDNLVLLGMSLGGYLAARAVAFEHRFRAAICYDWVYNNYLAFTAPMPKDALAALDAGDTEKCDEILRAAMRKNTHMR
jgi:alpha-beta hydrolase superfamily lysophospholipase